MEDNGVKREAARGILTEEELETVLDELKDKVLLLQVGSKACTRCPAFASAVAALAETHQFEWAYCDAHSEDTDLPELYGITQLPAFVMHAPNLKAPIIAANATAEQVAEAVVANCTPVFTTDADF